MYKCSAYSAAECASGSGGVTVLCITSLLVVSLLGHLFFMGLQQKLGSRSTGLCHISDQISLPEIIWSHNCSPHTLARPEAAAAFGRREDGSPVS